MKYDTSELCDIYHEEVNVVEPLFSNFGGRTSFGGQITTVKCFEDNGLLYDLLEENGRGRVLLIDGGGRVLTDDQLAITEGEVFTENPVKSTGRLGRLFNDRSTHHQRILVAFLELFDLLSCVGVFWFASLLVHPQSIGCADAVVVRKGCSPV